MIAHPRSPLLADRPYQGGKILVALAIQVDEFMNHLHHYRRSYAYGILLLIAGCASSQNATNGMSYVKTATGSLVQVTEDNFHIHMPTAFPGPMVTFHILNLSDHKHDFKIKGNGIEQQLTADLEAGQSADLTVNLLPGQYDIYCPLFGHADLGMRLTVTVAQP
jgi:uncharacterized cupredoxin-like copper-binding protein